VRTWTVVAVAALVAGACQFQFEGVALRQDQRVEIVSPDEFREQVQLPVMIDWTVRDFEVTGPSPASDANSGYFLLLVDVDPQPPGEGLDYFARDDVECRRSQNCPNEKYLAQKNIYTTVESEFTIEHLGPAPGVDLTSGDADVHEATIVLLDGTGHRIGEGSWSTTFELVEEE
jgi:hypothetical protein